MLFRKRKPTRKPWEGCLKPDEKIVGPNGETWATAKSLVQSLGLKDQVEVTGIVRRNRHFFIEKTDFSVMMKDGLPVMAFSVTGILAVCRYIHTEAADRLMRMTIRFVAQNAGATSDPPPKGGNQG